MMNITIETITPVHVGSGKELMPDTEYLTFEEGDNRFLVVIDHRKVLDIVGAENIQVWVNIVDRNESLKDYLQKRRPGLTMEQVASRIVTDFSNESTKNRTLKEQLHTASNLPQIPGSSIKGAIRSALLAYYVNKKPELINNESALKDRNNRFSAKFMEGNIFGKTPNDDTMRFLRVGDASFNVNTISVDMRLLNERYEGWVFKKGNRQLVECIPGSQKTNTRMKLDISTFKIKRPQNQTGFLDWKTLMRIVNNHTISLLKQEVDFWEPDEQVPEQFTRYMEDNIKELLSIAEACDENEAILRLGGNSGWDFITGGWIKKAWKEEIIDDRTYEAITREARHGRTYAFTSDFPKTRKMDMEGDILGFIKISVE